MIRFILVAAFVLACLVLGGASAAGAVANAVVQLLAILLLLALVWTRRPAPDLHPGVLVWLAAAFLALGLLQLVPLPPDLWTALPGRNLAREGFARLGLALPWLPFSLVPEGTVGALLAMLAPLAAALWLARLDARRRLWLVYLIVAFASASVLVGLAQKSQGAASALYFYEITNNNAAVGFFANRNHQATLLLMAVPLIGTLSAFAFARRNLSDRAAIMLLLVALYAIIALGILLTGSRAGLIILVPVTILTLLSNLLSFGRLALNRNFLLLLVLVACLGTAALVSRSIVAEPLAAGDPQSAGSRAAIWREAGAISLRFAPIGAGLGSFEPVYRMYEEPIPRRGARVNHAHNDYLEYWFETGLPGMAILLGFFAWFAVQAVRAWSDPAGSLARAASIAVGAVALHSLVDYPLRTSAIATLAAICCVLMCAPSIVAGRAPKVRGTELDEARA